MNVKTNLLAGLTGAPDGTTPPVTTPAGTTVTPSAPGSSSVNSQMEQTNQMME
jgi:hypothetical protein